MLKFWKKEESMTRYFNHIFQICGLVKNCVNIYRKRSVKIQNEEGIMYIKLLLISLQKTQTWALAGAPYLT